MGGVDDHDRAGGSGQMDRAWAIGELPGETATHEPFKETFAMSPAQLFGVMVRTVGLLVAASSFSVAFSGLMLAGSIPGSDGITALIIVLIVAAVVLLVGIWLVRGPKWLIAFAYPEVRGATDQPSAATH